MPDVKLPKGHGGFSVAGAQYKPNKNGVVEDVEEAHLPEALIHGATLIGDNAGAQEGDGGVRDFKSMRIGDLRTAFTEAFPGMDPAGAGKDMLVEALEKGWSVFGIGELRVAYKNKFGVRAPDELKAEDIIQALSADED